MKRGFEENVPKVRPRVRLGRALDEQLAEAQEPGLDGLDRPGMTAGEPEAQAHTEPPPPTRLEARPAEARDAAQAISEIPELQSYEEEAPRATGPRSWLSAVERLRGAAESPVPERAQPTVPERAQPTAAAAPATIDKPRSRKPSAGAQVAGLARELTAELNLAAEANGRIRQDLEAALTALRRAAEESRDSRGEQERLQKEVQRREAEGRELAAELQLVEAERDGALAQVARLSRELREAKARGQASGGEVVRARAEAAQAREAAQRLTVELQARTAERDEARAALLTSRTEREQLAEELLVATAAADEAAQSRTALEEIHQALAEARTRVARLR